MKQITVLVGFIILLIIGGGITFQVAYNGSDSLVSVIREQVDTPDGSFLEVGPSQAGILALLIVAALGGLISIGGAIAALMWFLHRSLVAAQAELVEGNGQGDSGGA